MYVIIMGLGRVGLSLANLLIDDGYDLTLIDDNEALCNEAAAELEGLLGVYDEAKLQSVLNQYCECVKTGFSGSKKAFAIDTNGSPLTSERQNGSPTLKAIHATTVTTITAAMPSKRTATSTAILP